MTDDGVSTRKQPASDEAGDGKHLVILVHGIRTFGDWQERLKTLIKGTKRDTTVLPYKYGYFSAIAFAFPPARFYETWKFRRAVKRFTGERRWDRIDIVAHSFGTHIVAHGLRGMNAGVRPMVRTIILAGSVLRSRFPWEELIGHSVKRVVNECGTHDSILLLSQFLSPLTGMAGRVGFYGMLPEGLVHRFHKFGHSDYFLKDGRPDDGFMRQHWLPLLTTDAAVPHISERGRLTALHGAGIFLANNSEPLKLALYLSPVLVLIVWMFLQWQQAVATSLAAESAAVIEREPDLGLLLSRHAYLMAPNDETRRALYGAMQTTRWIQSYLREHHSRISDVAFTGDGKRLASVQDMGGKKLVLWDAESANAIGRFPVDEPPEPKGWRIVRADGYKRVALTHNGTHVLLWHQDQLEIVQIDEWKTINGIPYRGDIALHAPTAKRAYLAGEYVAFDDTRYSSRTYLWPDDPVEKLQFTRDGGTLIAISPQKILLQGTQRVDDDFRGWHLPSGASLDVPGVKKLAVSDDNKWMAALTRAMADREERLKIWDFATRTLRHDLPTPHEWLGADVAFWPKRDLLVSSGGGGSTGGHSIGVWDPTSGRYLGPLVKGFEHATTAIAFSPDGRRLVSGDASGALILWDFGTRVNPHLGRRLDIGDDPVTAIAPAPRGDTLAAATASGDIVFFDVGANKVMAHLERAGNKPASSIAYDGAGNRLYVATVDGGVELWDPETRRMIRSRNIVPEGAALALKLHPARSLLLAIARSGAGWVIDPKSLETRAFLHISPGGQATFHPSAPVLLSTGTNVFSYLTAWDARRGERLQRYILSDDPRGVAVRLDGKRAVVLQGFDVSFLGEELTQSLAGKSADREPSKGELPAPPLSDVPDLKGHRNPPNVAVFSPDGVWLVTTGAHLAPVPRPDPVELEGLLLARQHQDLQQVFLWSAETGRSMGRSLWVPGPLIKDLRFGSNGRRLYSLSEAGKVIAWTFDPCAWTERARAVANRDFTKSERRQYLSHETWVYRALDWTRDALASIGLVQDKHCRS